MSCSNFPSNGGVEKQENQMSYSPSMVKSLSKTLEAGQLSPMLPDLFEVSVESPSRHGGSLLPLTDDELFSPIFPEANSDESPTYEIINGDSRSPLIWSEEVDPDCRPLNSMRIYGPAPERWIPGDAPDDAWLYDENISKNEICDSKDVPSAIGAGLANLGNTCFLNSIMQCFTHTVPLVEGLLLCSHSSKDGHNGYCVICAFRYHILNALQSTGRVISPEILVDNLNYFSSMFRRHQQEDAHEFMQCALDKLESCFLNLKKNDHGFNDDDIVKKVFGGSLVSKLRCCNCGRSSDTKETSIDMSLEIENVDNLSSALESFTMVENIDENIKCEGCNKEVSMEKQLRLDQTPSIAAFHLKRFKTDGMYVEKIEKHINFPLELDLQPYTILNENNNVSLKYNLYAVVVHIGFSSTSGHYFCFVRTAPDTWHKLDDSQVTKVSEETVLSQEAYILFYARQGTPWFLNFMESIIPSLELSSMNTSPKSVLDISDGKDKSFPILNEKIERSGAGESKEFSEKLDNSSKKSGKFVETDDIIDASHGPEHFSAGSSKQKTPSLNGSEDINVQVLPVNSASLSGVAKPGGSSYAENDAPGKNKSSLEVFDFTEDDGFNSLTPPNTPPSQTPGKSFQISRDHLKREKQGSSSGKRSSSSNKSSDDPKTKAALTYVKKMPGSRRDAFMGLIDACQSNSSLENKRKKTDSSLSDKGNNSSNKKSSHASLGGHSMAAGILQ